MKQGIYVNGKQVMQIANGNVQNMVATSQTISMVNGQVVIQGAQLIVDGQVITLDTAPVLHIEVFGNVNHIDAGSKSMVAGNCQWVDGVATLLVCGGDRVNVSYLSCSSVLRSTVGIGDSGISHR